MEPFIIKYFCVCLLIFEAFIMSIIVKEIIRYLKKNNEGKDKIRLAIMISILIYMVSIIIVIFIFRMI